MSHSEDRHLDFVLKHYQPGRFDTQKAIGRFKDANGIRPLPRRRWIFTISSMSAAAVILIGVFLFMHREARRWTEFAAVSQELVVLPDGTSVTLSAGSSLKWRMKQDCREVKMDGKAYFDVARDEGRPFEVDADGAFVRVLGTEFMVDVQGAETKVYVSEGKVLFARDAQAEGLILTQGMGASLAEGDEIPVEDLQTDINSIVWQRGTFIFADTPLKEVLACLSDYYKVSFIADDLSKKLSGEFHADDLDLIITLIESALDVNIIKR
ncbi:MAG: FecR domain-containing protein [Bacteroidales bacterium]|nr:FecR domain-containing protein [Bacteroidales bacterium]